MKEEVNEEMNEQTKELRSEWRKGVMKEWTNLVTTHMKLKGVLLSGNYEYPGEGWESREKPGLNETK